MTDVLWRTRLAARVRACFGSHSSGLAGKAAQHEAHHRRVDPRLGRLDQLLVVLRQAAVPAQPDGRPLHRSASRHHHESPRVSRAADDLQPPAARLLGPRR